MTKKKNAIVSLLLVVMFFSIIPIKTNAASVNSLQNIGLKSDEIETLQGMGFTEEELDLIPNNVLKETLQEHTDSFDDYEEEWEVIASEEKYYLVEENEQGDTQMIECTEEEAYEVAKEELKTPLIKPAAWAENSDLFTQKTTKSVRLTTTASHSKTSGERMYFFKNWFQWLTSPVMRLTDVVGLSTSTNISINTNTSWSEYTSNLRNVNNGSIIDQHYKSAIPSMSTYGATQKISLMGNRWGDHLGFIMYSGKAAQKNYTGYGNVCGAYAHQTLGTSGFSVSISPTGGLSFSGAAGITMEHCDGTNLQFEMRP